MNESFFVVCLPWCGEGVRFKKKVTIYWLSITSALQSAPAGTFPVGSVDLIKREMQRHGKLYPDHMIRPISVRCLSIADALSQDETILPAYGYPDPFGDNFYVISQSKAEGVKAALREKVIPSSGRFWQI